MAYKYKPKRETMREKTHWYAEVLRDDWYNLKVLLLYAAIFLLTAAILGSWVWIILS